MWRIIIALTTGSFYLLYLILCGGDQCIIAQQVPFTKIILQSTSCIFGLLAYSYINFKGHQNSAKKGIVKSQLVVAKHLLNGKMCKKDLKKSYFWAYVSMKSVPITNTQILEANNIIKIAEIGISQSNKKSIEKKAEDFLIKVKNPYTKKRKHEAEFADLVKSTIALAVLVAMFSAIPAFLMPVTLKLMSSPNSKGQASISGHAHVPCFKARSDVKDCLAPIYDFRDKGGKPISAVGYEDHKKLSDISATANKYDKLTVVYLDNDPTIVISEEGYLGSSALVYIFGIINLMIILSHIYICALNYKYKRDDKRI